MSLPHTDRGFWRLATLSAVGFFFVQMAVLLAATVTLGSGPAFVPPIAYVLTTAVSAVAAGLLRWKATSSAATVAAATTAGLWCLSTLVVVPYLYATGKV